MLNGQFALTDAIPAGVAAAASDRGFLRRFRPAALACLALAGLLAGCAETPRRAPIVDLNEQPAQQAASASGTYVVKPGDNLFRIARSNNVDIESLKRWNNITDPNQITVGQVLKLSGPAGTHQATPLPSSTAKPPAPVPLDQLPSQAGATPAPATPAPAPATHAADASLINWGWPAQGQVTQQFSASSKGIDIAGNPGDPVTAAADGKVMYSGNGVRGLGNLVIINHSNGFITAYAHNRALLVKTGQDVKRGTKIAELGESDTTSPKLHFEIRRQGTPVDPMQYLPAR